MKLKHIGPLGFLAACLLLGAASAGAARVKNGNFEAGNLSGGWHQSHSGQGGWAVNDEQMADPLGPHQEPIDGAFSAFTFQSGPSRMFLTRKLRLSAHHTHRLSFQLNYGSNAPFVNRPNFRLDHDNQQLRVEIVRAGAKDTSVANHDVLKTVFRTHNRAPSEIATRRFNANLSRYAGRTVKLRFAAVASVDSLLVELDSVKVHSKRKR